MSNVGTVVIQRFAGSCLPFARWPRLAQVLRGVRITSQPRQIRTDTLCIATRPSRRCVNIIVGIGTPRAFTQCFKPAFRQSRAVQHEAKEQERGLSFREDNLTPEELHDVFGEVSPPPRSANNLLRVLHGRRADGTLDLPFDLNVQVILKRYPYAMDSALYWLRENYPLDEDAAILDRIEREEQGIEDTPSQLQQRAQDVGLYAPQSEYSGPQSGRYQAKLSEEEGDVYGESTFDRMRAESLVKAEEEEKELQEQIDRITSEAQEKQQAKELALAERPEQGIEVAQEIRPPNEFEKWVLKAKNRATSDLTLDSPEVAERTFAQRMLPSAVFVALFCVGCFLFSQYWVPPKRSERIFPDVSLSFATIGTIAGLNLLIFALWGFPPAWTILTRYFVATPAFPRVVSMIGNTFSHQTARHFLFNMVALFVFGLSLHEDIGRGNFLPIYLASGAVGSLTSLTVFALKRNFVTSSIGASGSVWGVMAAYCWVHADEKFSFVFLPDKVQENAQFTGWAFLSVLILFEVVRLFTPVKTTDHASHIGGFVAGLVGAEMWKRSEDGQEAQKERKKGLRWYEILMGKQIIVDK